MIHESEMVQSKIVAVIFDWAGTIIDHGSRAPVEVFRRVFEERGIPVTTQQAREPMGKAKREHILSICRMPSVDLAWKSAYGHSATEGEVDRLYSEFLPLQKEVLLNHCEAIPGAKEAFAFLRSKEIKIGSSTGYTHALMDVLVPYAKMQGILPDVIICSDDVVAGRPKPWLIFEALQQLDCCPTWRTVIVDDTTVGIQAGIQAGCWTIAVRGTGNELGMSLEEVNNLPAEDLAAQLSQIEVKFKAIGADIVIDSVANLPEAIAEIETRLQFGQLPSAYD